MVGVIPRHVHRLWYGPRDMPQRYRDYGRTWEEVNDGWTVLDWEDWRPVILGPTFDACGVEWEVNPGGGKHNNAQAVQRADIASYELIWRYGGIYANCDLEAVAPLAEHLDGVDAFVCWEIDGSYLSNAFFGATAGHPFLAHVMEMLPSRLRDFPGHPMNEQTGPHLLTAAFHAWKGPAIKTFWSGQTMTGDGPAPICRHHWGHQVPDEELWP